MVHANDVPAPPADKPFTVYLARRKREITVAADRTLLQALHDAGVKWYGSCLEGRCSNCLCRVISGPIDHRDSVLSAAEKASNREMMICVSRAKSDVLELEL